MRRRLPREEPLTIDGKVVAKTLDDLGFHGMASFVRHLDGIAQDANVRQRGLSEQIRDLAKRLEAYEPPPPPPIVRRTSEWD